MGSTRLMRQSQWPAGSQERFDTNDKAVKIGQVSSYKNAEVVKE